MLGGTFLASCFECFSNSLKCTLAVCMFLTCSVTVFTTLRKLACCMCFAGIVLAQEYNQLCDVHTLLSYSTQLNQFDCIVKCQLQPSFQCVCHIILLNFHAIMNLPILLLQVSRHGLEALFPLQTSCR